MLSIGVVAVRAGLSDRFYRELRPISDRWIPEALEVCQLDRDQLITDGADPAVAMAELRSFVAESTVGQPVFISDNPGFDFGFVRRYPNIEALKLRKGLCSIRPISRYACRQLFYEIIRNKHRPI